MRWSHGRFPSFLGFGRRPSFKQGVDAPLELGGKLHIVEPGLEPGNQARLERELARACRAGLEVPFDLRQLFEPKLAVKVVFELEKGFVAVDRPSLHGGISPGISVEARGPPATTLVLFGECRRG